MDKTEIMGPTEYAELVDALHDAALRFEAPDDLVINALISVAIEAAFGIYGPDEGAALVRKFVKQHLADAIAQGVGEPGYYSERH
jgi:hypothetical protein